MAHQELDSARTAVIHGACQLQCLLAHLLARLFVEEDRGRLLEHLLVAPLHRALALVEVDSVPVPIKQHLTGHAFAPRSAPE